MAFDPNQHMSKLKGKDYLEVKWRLVWFREDHPDWGIETNIYHYDEKQAIVQAKIYDTTGTLKAMGTKQECPKDFADYLEKAETGSIGRALATLGYGTQFAPELEEGERIVDSPVQPARQQTPTRSTQTPTQPVPAEGTNQSQNNVTNDDADNLLKESVKHTGGWEAVLEQLNARALPSYEGKSREDTKKLFIEWLTTKFARNEFDALVKKVKGMPNKSQKPQGGNA